MDRFRLLTLSVVSFLMLSRIGTTDEAENRVVRSQVDRQTISLNGPWLFQRDGEGNAWKTVDVPNSFEMHEGTDFDGVGWYRRELPGLVLEAGQRAIVRFHGAATQASVWCNSAELEERRVGEHLGGWTPFDCDVTEYFTKSGTAAEIKVRIDELPGHNSQGFLPVFSPHFGGLWQDVELIVVPAIRLNDLSVLTVGNRQRKTLSIECSALGEGTTSQNSQAVLTIAVRERGARGDWMVLGDLKPREPRKIPSGNSAGHSVWQFAGELPVEEPKTWSPDHPHLYDVRLLLTINGQEHDVIYSRCAFRDVEIREHQLLLNGKPLQVRGILNWGYAPPDVCPSRDPEFWKQEIALLQSHGFNLMKFCLWVPPRGYLEMADEMGVLTWMEYPTWHSQWTKDRQADLEREFTEFFQYDRNHPSIVLRSLTCETGPSADLEVIRSLYDRCHEMIPGSVVEDDSSWIEWNRVHDFYDDHPYGNNHTWPATLERLKTYVQEHGVKPLILGEAIAADTWVDPGELIKVAGSERPFWLPGFLDDNIRWQDERLRLDGFGAIQRLRSDSLRYAMLMRKYQIEEYRQRVEFGGYVVSVIRDFPFAGMGLMDFQSRPKWTAKDWAWHGDSLLILQTPDDRRGFFGDQSVPVEILLSHFGAMDWDGAQLVVSIDDEVVGKRQLPAVVHQGVMSLANETLALPRVEKPTRQTVRVRLEKDGRLTENSWDLWVLPRPVRSQSPVIHLHESVGDQLDWMSANWDVKTLASIDEGNPGAETGTAVTIASRFDHRLLYQLEKGARVILLPGGGPGSLPTHQHWFLRGGPVFGSHSLLKKTPAETLLDLQHFDFGSPVVSDIQWLEHVDPVMMLWDNHDIKRVRTHGLLFETGVGNGRLMVCTLNVTEAKNEAGVWLLDEIIREISSPVSPRRSLTSEQVQGMKNKLVEKKVDLTGREWRFRTDPDNQGLLLQWQFSKVDDPDEWKPMSIGKHWEGLGYESLDGWAWYRIDVDLDESWAQQPVHVWIDGADDYYELYVNGQLCGTAGDIESKRTAFEDRLSFDVSHAVGNDRKLHMVIRVYDWYGAGGLFRPIHVSTTPLSTAASILN